MFSADLGVQAAGAPPFAGTQFLAVGHQNSPFVTVYPWSSSTGFGTKFINPSPLPNTSPNSAARGVAFTPSGNALAVFGGGELGKNVIPYGVSVYAWTVTGFGSKFADPPSRPNGPCLGGAFSTQGNAIILLGSASSTFDNAYALGWSGSGFGARLTTFANIPSTGLGCSFSPTGNAVAIAHSSGDRISAFAWTGSTFGTQFAAPSVLPAGVNSYGCAFSPSGNALAVAHENTPFISVYPWTVTGFGTKVADPTTRPTGIGNGCSFSPSGDALAVAHNNTPYITVYPWTGSSFGTKFADPTTPVANIANSCAFSPDGQALAIAHYGTPYISAYRWTSTGFGTQFVNPTILPPSSAFSCAFGVIP